MYEPGEDINKQRLHRNKFAETLRAISSWLNAISN